MAIDRFLATEAGERLSGRANGRFPRRWRESDCTDRSSAEW